MCRRGVAGPVLAVLLRFVGPAYAGGAVAPSYFPLGVGNWWSYEEQDDDGKALSRETWTLVPGEAHAGEFHLRALAKRLDALGRGSRRWEGNEYLRRAADGLHKRYPAGHEAELDVQLLKEPASTGTRWQDAQGECVVTALGVGCVGPRGELPDCLVVVCRQGRPTSTTVTSTYARDVGMVRQEVEVLQLLPQGSGPMVVRDDATKGHSLLRLIGYHVGPPR